MRMISERKAELLNTLVKDYIRSAIPIASEKVAQKHSLGISSATIRNYMAEFEENGYITRPHHYSGAIPSDKGYRFYVESILTIEDIPAKSRHTIHNQFKEAESDIEAWTGMAAISLSQLTNNAAVVSYPKQPQSKFLRINLVYIQDSLAFLILVLEKVHLRKQLLPLIEPISNDQLQFISNKLSDSLKGLNREEIMEKNLDSSPFETKVMDIIIKIMESEDRNNIGETYVYGLKELLKQPEFSNGQKAREIVDVIEDKQLPKAISSETSTKGEMKVIIGRENRFHFLHPLSMVVCQYGLLGEESGSIGVLGPKRMEYPKTIASVKFISSLMTDLFTQVTV